MGFRATYSTRMALASDHVETCLGILGYKGTKFTSNTPVLWTISLDEIEVPGLGV